MGGTLKPRHLINLDGKHYTPQSNKDYGYYMRNYTMKERERKKHLPLSQKMGHGKVLRIPQRDNSTHTVLC